MSAHDNLLRAAASGDDQALETLVREYHHRVHRFGVRVCRDRFDADDAVQEAFMKLSQRPDVQRDRGALSWLMTTVRNACLRMFRPFTRERARLGDRIALEAIVDARTPDRALERWRVIEIVHRAIASLPPDARNVLVLRDIEGMSGEDVASMLGISVAAMKSRLFRARTTMRSLLLEHDEIRELVASKEVH